MSCISNEQRTPAEAPATGASVEIGATNSCSNAEASRQFVIPSHVMGRPDTISPRRISIYGTTQRGERVHPLREQGFLGLVFPEGKTLFQMSQENDEERTLPSFYAGVYSKWWVPMVESGLCTSNIVKSHDDSNQHGRYLVCHDYFPVEAILSSVMCLVTKYLAVSLDIDLVAGTPQYLLSSTNGFSSRYWTDIPGCSYRIFLYLGREYDPSPEAGYETSSEELDCAFVLHGRNATISVVDGDKEYQVVTLLGLYREGEHKFALFPGDILVLEGGIPWCVELPYAIWSPCSRMVSWSVYNRSVSDIELQFPIVPSKAPQATPYFDECLHHPDVKRKYEQDLRSVLERSGRFPVNGTGDVFNDSVRTFTHMRRARVLREVYSSADTQQAFRDELEKGNLFDISTFF